MTQPVFDIDIDVDLGAFTLKVDLRSSSQRLAVTGPSGAGKTTLLRVVAGLEDAAAGRVAFRGDVWQAPGRSRVEPWERRAGWLPQDSLVFPHLTARENLRYAEPADRDVAAVVDALELGDRLDASARELSGGERQRVAMGRALLSDPRLLLADEPFSALDARLTDRISRFLDDWCARRDCAMLFAVHTGESVEALVGETVRLEQGRVAST